MTRPAYANDARRSRGVSNRNVLEGVRMIEVPTCDLTALRAAAKASPGDPMPKLALADLLDEVGIVQEDCRQFGYDPGEFHAMCARCYGRGFVRDHSAPIEAALLRVLAEPHSDERRLQYADAVEPVDKERAEFVRDQIKLHNRPCRAFMYSCQENGCRRCECSPEGEWLELYARERKILSGGPKWSRPLSGCGWAVAATKNHGNTAVPVFDWERGFAFKVTVTAFDWLANRAELRDLHPIEVVRLTTYPEMQIQPNPEKPLIDSRLRFRGETEESDWVSVTEIARSVKAGENWLKYLLSRKDPQVRFTLPNEVDK